MDRRRFVKDLAALGCLGLAGGLDGPKAPAFNAAGGRKNRNGFDGNLVVFISDLHFDPAGYQPDKLRKVVSEILAMRPLPKNVISLGDNAYLTGQVSEYEGLRPVLQPLMDAGITLTMAMGNHDRREEFARVFPEIAARSVLGDRMVFIVETPRADFIILDSLQQGEDRSTWIGEGAIDEAQAGWLKRTLDSYSKPVFVCAHHGYKENNLKAVLTSAPTCCGYINGHHHRWTKDFIRKNWKETHIVRTLGLPSTGHWGDIGYAVAVLGDSSMKVTLHQSEFFFPEPVPEGRPAPALWKAIAGENRGQVCEFPY